MFASIKYKIPQRFIILTNQLSRNGENNCFWFKKENMYIKFFIFHLYVI